MRIEWIGTGSGLNPTLGNTSFLVRGDDNRVLLVDCGATVAPALMNGMRIKEVTDIVITHTHADHIGGLEGFGFMHYFALKNRGEKRPRLHLATHAMAEKLWNESLCGGMHKIQTDENMPMDATLKTFFDVCIGHTIEIPGIPKMTLCPTQHVHGLENYALRFDNGIYYSGDTVELPPSGARIIFQDCQFYETPSDVHISYDKLARLMPAGTKAVTWLVHLGGGWDKKDPKAEGYGFAGFVQPGQVFEF